MSHLNPFVKGKIGGGEYITRAIIKTANENGVDVKHAYREEGIVSRFIRPQIQLHPKPDLWILCDIFNIPEHQLSFKKGFLEHVIENEKFVHFDNAYVDICSQGALPCSGERSATSCNSCLKDNRREAMYKKSVKNFFLSPMHASVINQFFKNDFRAKTEIVRPFLDSSVFFNQGLERDIEYLYAGTIADYKGYKNIKNAFAHVGDNFYFIGRKSRELTLFSKNHIEYISPQELSVYYNRAKRFVHLPVWREPMARTVIEAAVCGCEIITNENVGAKSFEFNLANPVNYLNAEKEFWTKIKML